MNVAASWPTDMLILIPAVAALLVAAWPKKGRR